MLASKSENIRNLFLGLFSGISAADRPSLVVNEEHLRLCFRPSHAKETFQHKNHELHWSSVVIQQQYVATLEVRHYGSPGLGPINKAACMRPLAVTQKTPKPTAKCRGHGLGEPH